MLNEPNALEEYAQEVKEAIRCGLVVPAIAGSTFYTVVLQYLSKGATRKVGERKVYLADEKSAQNYLVYRLYKSIYWDIKNYWLDIQEGDLGRAWTRRDTQYIMENLKGGKTPNTFDPKIGREIAEFGQSERLLQWFLNTDYKYIWAWHRDMTWCDTGSLFNYGYHINQTKIGGDSWDTNLTDRGIHRITVESLEGSSILRAVSPELEISLDSEDAIRVALALGAEVDAVPETSFFRVYGHYYSQVEGEDKKDRLCDIYYVDNELKAEQLRLAFVLFELIEHGGLAPWKTPENAIWNYDDNGWNDTALWHETALVWLKDNSYEALVSFIKDLRALSPDEGYPDVFISRESLRGDFDLTYDSLKSVEKKEKVG